MDVHLKACRAGVLSAGLGHISEPYAFRAKPPPPPLSLSSLKPPGILGVPGWGCLHSSEPRLVHGPQAFVLQERLAGQPAEPPGSELSRSPPPPHPATWAPVEHPKSVSGDSFLHHLPLQTVYYSTGLRRPDKYSIPSLPGSFGQSGQPMARVWFRLAASSVLPSHTGPMRGCPQHTGPWLQDCLDCLVLLGFDEEIHASVIIPAAGHITHLRCIKAGAGFQECT
ncbi:uncharacterized protein LOC119870469 [Canis lupus familiaris]|uniref:uncharacterized protein LOC119870469 n=1 Tax=Canis lupus familiaris TaxID=9615 RepID=UPI0015F18391|nr:uncharacterized protein LOC119870469 [Canis lupus familiaris]XP_038516061.1 uncharacterized protein LOC119870469 [Canis lupus familiaris]